MITLSQLVNAQLSRDESKEAFIFEDDHFSYRQVDQITDEIGGQLSGQFEAHDLLALWLPNSPGIIFAYVAAFKANRIPMPIHFESSVSEVSRILAQARARHLIVASELNEKITEEWLSTTSIEKVWNLEDCQLNLVFECGKKSDSRDLVVNVGGNTGLVLHTSGSSGQPKGVVLSKAGLSHVVEDRVTTAGICNDSFAVVASSLSHSVGLYQVLALLSQGASFELLAGYDNDQMARSINEHHPSHLIMVVSAFNQLLDHPDVNEASFCDIKFSSVGADRVTQGVQNKYRALTGNNLSVSYGMTEFSWILVNKEKNPEQCLALGRPAAGSSVELRGEHGNVVPQGSVGEIFARGRKSMQGYLNQSGLDALTLQDGWIRSGDLAYQDDSGLYWFVGRATDLIVLSSGDNVSPAEIEHEILTIPGISDCIVIGMHDDEQDSDVPWAFVTCDGTRCTSKDSGKILEYLHSRLSDYKQPEKLFFLDELPRGASGKLSRKKMKQWCASNIAELSRRHSLLPPGEG